MEESAKRAALEAFAPLIGKWRSEATHPMFPGEIVTGEMTYEWLSGEAFLIQRSAMSDPRFPDSIVIVGFTDDNGDAGEGDDSATDELVGHYFDSRGVFRVYRLAMDDRTLRIWRDAPGFSQRLEAVLSEDGSTLAGVWQLAREDESFEDDLAITFRRA